MLKPTVSYSIGNNILTTYLYADPENSVGGGVLTAFFSHQRFSHRTVGASPQ